MGTVRTRVVAVVAGLLLSGTGLAFAQMTPAAQVTAPPPAPVPPAQTPADAQPVPAPVADPYAYDPGGRRDPFVSLLSRGMESEPGKKTTGLASLATGDVMLRGVLQSRGSFVALLSSPDGKTYPAHVNDRLLDGVIRSVTAEGIVIMQDVNDPLSLVKQREVRKGLRTVEDAK